MESEEETLDHQNQVISKVKTRQRVVVWSLVILAILSLVPITIGWFIQELPVEGEIWTKKDYWSYSEMQWWKIVVFSFERILSWGIIYYLIDRKWLFLKVMMGGMLLEAVLCGISFIMDIIGFRVIFLTNATSDISHSLPVFVYGFCFFISWYFHRLSNV